MSVDTGELFSLGAIVVRGPDAAEFLNAQLSTQVPQTPDATQLTAWNTPKGRVRAVIFAISRGSEWLLLTHPSLQDSIAQGLARYVLRARVEIAAAGHQGLALIPGGGCDNRGHRIGNFAFDWAQQTGEPGLTNAAALALVESGIPLIDHAGTERHLPHSLNLDRLEAVAFDKGCFPGQEIIARTQNLGRIKRRVVALSCAGSVPQSGTAVLDGSGEKRGEVVLAAKATADVKLLATLELRALGDALTLEAGHRRLARARLPYSVPEIDAADP